MIILTLILTVAAHAQTPDVVAHKGLHIPFRAGAQPDPRGCVAQMIDDPANYPTATRYNLENTLPAISTAFQAGATRVSINLQVTSDGHVVLFHDLMLDCRTNGSGLVSDMTLAGLQALNVGWNYSANNGKTFPWRDPALPAATVTMPSLEDAFDANPGKSFWIVARPNSADQAKAIFSALAKYPDIVKVSALFASDWVNQIATEELPQLQIARVDDSRSEICMNGFVPGQVLPTACANLDLMAPYSFVSATAVDEFATKLAAMNSKLYVGSEGGGFVDDTTAAGFIKAHASAIAGFMTDRIDLVGPLF